MNGKIVERPEDDHRPRRRGAIVARLLAPFYRLLRWLAGHVRGFFPPLTLLLLLGLALALGAAALFLGIAAAVAGGGLERADRALLDLMAAHRSPWLDALALAGAVLGSSAALWTALAAGTVLLARARHLWSVALLWVSLGGAWLLATALKGAYHRPRPGAGGGPIEALGFTFAYPSSSSFPSGHALTAVVVYGTLAYLVARIESTRRARRATLAGALALVLMICLSRVYLGVHYPSDVAAGFLAGFAWATACALGIEAARILATRRPEVRQEEAGLDQGIDPLSDALGVTAEDMSDPGIPPRQGSGRREIKPHDR